MEHLDPNIPALLVAWYRQNRRELPWRRDREPYHVWLSEIMLQQTRVEAARAYYLRFLAELPTVQALADCPPDRLSKLWEGLGYYARMRNLQKAARQIAAAGRFPDTYAELLALPGVGAYTAGAVASICFEQPAPAVDGNVLRVLARVTEDASPVTDARVKKEYAARLGEIYPAGACGDFTQSLMELGAVVCVPNGPPRCGECPLRALCRACADGVQEKLPVRSPKKARRTEEKTVLILRCGDRLAVRKRPDEGLLAGLWELPNVPGTLEAQQALALAEAWGAAPRELVRASDKTHVFTHLTWNLRGYELVCAREAPGFLWADAARLRQDVALPTAFRMFLGYS